MKKIILISRNFWPENIGFANSATSLYHVMNRIPSIQVCVVTLSLMKGLNDSYPNVFRARRESALIGGISDLFVSALLRTRVLGSCAMFLKSWVDDWMIYRSFKKHFTIHETDHIIFETNVFPFLGPKLLKIYREKVVIRLHATEDTELLCYTRSFIFRSTSVKNRVLKFCQQASNVYSTSSYYLDFFKREILFNNPLYIYDKSYEIIPNAVEDVSKLGSAVRCLFDLPERYVLFLGNLSTEGWYQKGLADIIRALSLKGYKGNDVCRQNPEDLTIVVVGKGLKESEFRSQLEMNDLVGNFIHIRETLREETFWLLNHASFVILPSRFEGQSMFLTEALSAGKPIITTQGTGSSHLVSNSNGVLVEKGNLNELREAILRLWLSHQSDLTEMGKNSRILYERRYSYEAVASVVETCFLGFK